MMKTSATLLLMLVALGVPAKASEWVKVTNKSGGTIRVKVWVGINVKAKTLKKGKSFSWKRNNTTSYNVTVYRKEGKLIKVWKAKKTKKKIDYSSDVTIGKKLKIITSKPRHFVMKNSSSKAVVVKLFKGKDNVRLFSLKKFTIQPGKSATYRSVEPGFNASVFELKSGLDRHVATAVDIPRKSTLVVSNKNGWTATVKK